MSRRPSLPPPPPPVEIRTWPDREAMLADRALILRALVGMHLGPGRLGVLVIWAGLAAFGWLLVGSDSSSSSRRRTSSAGSPESCPCSSEPGR